MTALFTIKMLLLWMVWIALSGSYTIANLLLGAVVAGFVAGINAWYAPSRPVPGRWSVMAGLAYLPWLFVRVVASSVHLTRLILHPRLPIDPQVVRYAPSVKDPRAIVLMGNSITLTPGTITMEADSDHLLIHAMDQESASDLVSGRLERKVQSVFSSAGIHQEAVKR